MKLIGVTLTDEIKKRKIPLEISVLQISGIKVFDTNPALDTEFESAVGEVLKGFTLETVSSDKVVKAVRELFKAFGTDPTRWRPSSEAMIRRILKEKGLYRINSLVDINNIISVRYRLPIGLYDLDKVDGAIKIDIGRQGRTFIGLTGREYDTDGKPMVSDETGIIGGPIVDSERTKIDFRTENALVVIFAGVDGPRGIAASAADAFAGLICRFHPEAELSKTRLIG